MVQYLLLLLGSICRISVNYMVAIGPEVVRGLFLTNVSENSLLLAIVQCQHRVADQCLDHQHMTYAHVVCALQENTATSPAGNDLQR